METYFDDWMMPLEIPIIMVYSLPYPSYSGHEYGHWAMSIIDPEHGSPGKLGYDFTPNASPGGGENGYASEIALFGFFTIRDRNSHSDSDDFAYSNFRAIDINNVAHHLPLAEIRNCCNRGYYEKIELSREVEIGYMQGATGMPVLMEYGARQV